jgi:hypothetical protein
MVMPNETSACRKEQDALLESFMSAGESASLSADLRVHLESCASCRQYWHNLGVVQSGYTQDLLYSPFLRAKTLRRLANRDQAIRVAWLPLVVVAALLSLSLSYVLPAFLLSRIFMHWTSLAPFAYAASLGIVLVLGVLATAAAAISLIERGYIRLSDGKGISNPTESPAITTLNGFPSL